MASAASLRPELAGDNTLNSFHRFRNAQEVSGQLCDQVTQVEVFLQDPVVGDAADLTTSGDTVPFSGQLPDLGIQPPQPVVPVRVRIARATPGRFQDRPDTGLAEHGPLARQTVAVLNGFLVLTRQLVLLTLILLAGQPQPLLRHPRSAP